MEPEDRRVDGRGGRVHSAAGARRGQGLPDADRRHLHDHRPRHGVEAVNKVEELLKQQTTFNLNGFVAIMNVCESVRVAIKNEEERVPEPEKTAVETQDNTI